MNGGTDQLVLSFDRGTLLLTGAGRDLIASLFAPNVWTCDSRVSTWRCFAIHYPDMRRLLTARCGSSFQDQVPVPADVRWPKLDLLPLRADQQEALRNWKQSRCRGQVIMPTGSWSRPFAA